MKLTSSHIHRIKSAVDAKVIDPSTPLGQKLIDQLGDHTFMLDDEGVHTWDYETDPNGRVQALAGYYVASWENEQRTTLVPHPPAKFKELPLFDDDPPDNAA